MKNASDFRRLAREALRGRWIMAVLVGIVASLLGGIGTIGPEFKINLDLSGADISLNYGNQVVFSTNGGLNPHFQAFLIGGAFAIILVALVFAVIYYVIGSVIGVGYARFNLELADHREIGFESMFSSFPNWKTTSIARLMRSLFTFLWSLLFIIPGIIASYSYAMTDYILAEHPELTASEAIAHSKELMKGNRFRLFCLDFSFIGWGILCGFTFGIGNLFLTPYTQAAKAGFYREISGTEYYYSGDVYEEQVYDGEVF